MVHDLTNLFSTNVPAACDSDELSHRSTVRALIERYDLQGASLAAGIDGGKVQGSFLPYKIYI